MNYSKVYSHSHQNYITKGMIERKMIVVMMVDLVVDVLFYLRGMEAMYMYARVMGAR